MAYVDDRRITDSIGDTITVSSNEFPTLQVALEIQEDDQLAQAFLDRDKAIEVANAILEHVRYEPEVEPEVTTPAAIHGDDPREAWNLSALTVAERLSLPVTFRYTKNGDGDPQERRLSKVTDVFESKAGNFLVEDIDPNRDDVRHFRLDWIRDYVMVVG